MGKIEQEIQQEIQQAAQLESRLNLENVRLEWANYAQKTDSMSLRVAMLDATLRLENDTVFAKVDMVTRKNLLQEELTKISDQLRTTLHDPSIKLVIEVDEKKAEAVLAAPPPKRFLSAREKLEMMHQQNPLVADLIQKFDLVPIEH